MQLQRSVEGGGPSVRLRKVSGCQPEGASNEAKKNSKYFNKVMDKEILN
jgi:hypothetical protein